HTAAHPGQRVEQRRGGADPEATFLAICQGCSSRRPFPIVSDPSERSSHSPSRPPDRDRIHSPVKNGGVAVDLIVPLKEPSRGKSRLRDGLGCPVSDHRHAELVLAFAFDTLRAATATPGVRRVLVVSSVPAALTALREDRKSTRL